MYELADGIKMLHMTFSTSHNCEIPVQLVYRLQQFCKLTYNELYSLKHVATHSSLISYFKIFIKMLHMTFSTSHNCEIPVQLVYRLVPKIYL